MDTDTKITDTLVALADTLVADYDVVDFMQLLADRTVELLDVNAAGLMLADRGDSLGLAAWTSETVRRLELFELSADQGPCRDCYHSGRQLVNISVHDACKTWPEFGQELIASGLTTVHALPMRLRGEVIGSLNLFQNGEAAQLADSDVRLGQALADVATIGLLQARALAENGQLAEQLQSALNSRVILEQAKGALAERQGIDIDVAFARMRTYARSNGLRLSDVAKQVLEAKLNVLA
jgi:GAF domain-containing protein